MPPQELTDPSTLDDGVDVSNRLEFSEPSTPEEWAVAQQMTGETPEVRSTTLTQLRNMINSRMELPNRTEEGFLIKFLRARNFNVDKSYNLLVRYYRFKDAHPNFHKDVYPLRLTIIGDDDVVSVPPYRDQNGHRIIIYRLGNWKPSNYSVDEIFKATVVILELANLEPNTQIKGGVAIFDMSGITMSHMCHFTPAVASQIMELMGGSFPIKIHAIHVVLQSFLFGMIFAIFKPLLDGRTRDRIFIHGHDMESLHTHIDPRYLPAKYGGIRKEYSYNDWIETLKLDETVIRSMWQLGYKIDPEDDATGAWMRVAQSLQMAS